jgi:hypothetical protein
VVITRYTLPLPILRQIWGLFGLFKTHEGTLGTPNQYFWLCMRSPSCYLPIPCQLRLNILCTWCRNLKIFIFFSNYADSGAFRPQGPCWYRRPPQKFSKGTVGLPMTWTIEIPMSMQFGKLLLILEHLTGASVNRWPLTLLRLFCSPSPLAHASHCTLARVQ